MIGKLLRSLREFTWAAILSPLCMVGEVYMEVRIPRIIAQLLDQGITPGNIDVGGQSGFTGLACDGSGNHCGRMAVTGVILYDQYRAGAPLLTAHHRGQIRIKYVSALDCCFIHCLHAPCIFAGATGKILM